ncbi:MAG: hypothetical protein ACLRT4_18100 [Thomasclavelia sp.]
MAKNEFVLNKAGVRELLRSDEMLNICKSYANEAQNRLGEGYKVTSMKGRNRVNASIAADSYEAKKETFENNTILKALR